VQQFCLGNLDVKSGIRVIELDQPKTLTEAVECLHLRQAVRSSSSNQDLSVKKSINYVTSEVSSTNESFVGLRENLTRDSSENFINGRPRGRSSDDLPESQDCNSPSINRPCSLREENFNMHSQPNLLISPEKKNFNILIPDQKDDQLSPKTVNKTRSISRRDFNYTFCSQPSWNSSLLYNNSFCVRLLKIVGPLQKVDEKYSFSQLILSVKLSQWRGFIGLIPSANDGRCRPRKRLALSTDDGRCRPKIRSVLSDLNLKKETFLS